MSRPLPRDYIHLLFVFAVLLLFSVIRVSAVVRAVEAHWGHAAHASVAWPCDGILLENVSAVHCGVLQNIILVVYAIFPFPSWLDALFNHSKQLKKYGCCQMLSDKLRLDDV